MAYAVLHALAMRTSVSFVALLASATLGGCISDPGTYMHGDQPDAAVTPGSPDAAPPPPGATEVSGDITTSGTWMDAVRITASATIKPGVTITVAPGTKIYAAADASLFVEGTLLAQGTAASMVVFGPDTGVSRWPGLDVSSGGAATLAYTELSHAQVGFTCETGAATCDIQSSHFHDNSLAANVSGPMTTEKSLFETNGSFAIQSGSLTFTDSVTTGSSGDLLVQAGGALTVQYSQVGSETTGEHCGLHINASGTLQVDHSLIKADVYGFMLGGSPTAKINHNNFVGNTMMDVEDDAGNSGADLSNNYWTSTPPNVAGATVLPSAPTAFTDVGPRP